MTGDTLSKIARWYHDNERALPWREHPANPYHVWISEIMLQQTRIEAVIPYYFRFIELFPDVQALAAAPEEMVLKAWEGLGYYSRARNLQKAARVIASEYDGAIPADYDKVRALPGIGDYTAAAIFSIAFGKPYPAVDGNVLRVVSRLTASRDDVLLPETKKRVTAELCTLFPSDCASGDVTQGLMELGELICLPGSPCCEDCPVYAACEAFAQGLTNELPHRDARTAKQTIRRVIPIIEKEGKLLLYKRPAGGVLAGLWEFPDVQTLAVAGIEPAETERVGHTKHVFTHLIWEMEVCDAKGSDIGVLPEGFIWADSEELLRITLPKASQKVLECYRTALSYFP